MTCFAPKSIKLLLLQAQLAESQRQIEELKQIAELKTIVSGLRAGFLQLLSRTEAWNNLMTIEPSALGRGGRTELRRDHAQGPSRQGDEGQRAHCNGEAATAEDGLNKVSVKIEIGEGKTVDAILVKYDSNEQAFVMQLMTSERPLPNRCGSSPAVWAASFPSGPGRYSSARWRS